MVDRLGVMGFVCCDAARFVLTCFEDGWFGRGWVIVVGFVLVWL